MMAWASPVQAPRSQATMERLAHFVETCAKRPSSRPSAAKLFTVGLPVTESASVPLSRESISRAARLAGLTHRIDRATLTLMKTTIQALTSAPSKGQRRLKVTVTPITTMSAGARLKASVSVNVSKEFIPRVILRTVAPAKLLACQSEEKRCTLAKASRPMAVMARALMRLSRKVTSWRDT